MHQILNSYLAMTCVRNIVSFLYFFIIHLIEKLIYFDFQRINNRKNESALYNITW
jgi:hypothetical protein